MSGKPNSGIDGAAGYAISQANITRLIHGDAAHPAEAGIWSEGALLRENRGPIGILDLIPARTAAGSGSDGVIHHQ